MPDEKKKKLYIIDGTSNIYRAYYAIRGLSTKEGFATNAVYGFIQMLRKLLSDHAPDFVCVALDPPGPTIRHEEFREYKAHRKPMPEDLVSQIPYVKKVCAAFRVPVIEKERFEADDVIGTMVRKAEASNLDAVIVSVDKDMFQLVGDGVSVLQTRGENVLFDPEKVEKEFGARPGQVTDVLGLWGDASDNIPGVPGIGEKGAKALIKEFGSLENCLASLDKIGKKKTAESLKNNADQAVLSKKLATILTDLDLDFDLQALRSQAPDREKLVALFRELEFTSLLSEFLPDAQSVEKDYKTIIVEEELRALLEAVRAAGFVSVDTETDARQPMNANIVGFSLSLAPYTGFYIPTGHDYLGAPEQLPLETVLSLLSPILEDPSIQKIGQNIKYEVVLLKNHGMELQGISEDTMIASYLLDPSYSSHSLDAIAEKYLQYRTIKFQDVAGKGKNQTTLNCLPIPTVAEYAIEDADVTLRAARLFRDKLEKESLGKIYEELELPLIPVLAEMEQTGVKIDSERLAVISGELESDLATLTARIHEMAGQTFNINSPKQLSEILFTKLKLQSRKKTKKTGTLSTGVEVLEELSREHDLPGLVLEYRQMAKLKGTYVDALPTLVHPRTGRIHTSFNQSVTATGRLSSSEPNLQNIPVRTPLGKKIRQAFIAEPGRLLFCADYSQIELRVLAHLSGDEKLCQAFHEGQDIHSQTASEVFGVPRALIEEEMRRRAKAINFGIIYGMSPFGLAKELGISRVAARDYIEKYFERYPGIRTYIDESLEEARKTGVVRTLLGRLRHVPDLQNPNKNRQMMAERIAVNTPIQGTAADIIKLAMINISGKLKEEGLQTRMLLQVHDELVFEVPEEEREQIKALVQASMEGVFPLHVPLKVDCGLGPNWMDAKG